MTVKMRDDVIKSIASKKHDHARRCKKATPDCKECQANIKWFAELPLPTLSVVLSEAYTS